MTAGMVEELLAGCAAEVLETMFFLTPAENRDPMPFPEDALAVRVAFEGRPSGVFRLALGIPGAMLAAENFAGGMEAVSADQARLTAAEMANMICGAVLSRLESGTRFALSTPEPEETAAPGAWGGTLAVIEFEEAGPLAVALEVDS